MLVTLKHAAGRHGRAWRLAGRGARYTPDRRQARRVYPAITRALGLREAETGEPLQSLRVFLRDRTALFVLDNLEQVEAGGVEVATLLKQCPSVKVLTSSRIPLRAYGEHEYPLSPLALPAAEAREVGSRGARHFRAFVVPGGTLGVRAHQISETGNGMGQRRFRTGRARERGHGLPAHHGPATPRLRTGAAPGGQRCGRGVGVEGPAHRDSSAG